MMCDVMVIKLVKVSFKIDRHEDEVLRDVVPTKRNTCNLDGHGRVNGKHNIMSTPTNIHFYIIIANLSL